MLNIFITFNVDFNINIDISTIFLIKNTKL